MVDDKVQGKGLEIRPPPAARGVVPCRREEEGRAREDEQGGEQVSAAANRRARGAELRVGGAARERADGEQKAGKRRGNDRFLPNALFIVSCCLGLMVDAVSQPRNDFFTFHSLSSFIDLPCHFFRLRGTLFIRDRNHN
jgi:hypothetical protein